MYKDLQIKDGLESLYNYKGFAFIQEYIDDR